RIKLNVPIRLILITRSKSPSGIGPSRPTIRLARPMPAQLMRMRAAPCLARASETALAAASASLTSHLTASAPIFAAPSFIAFSLTSRSVTLAPCLASTAAVAAPRPEPPPVTSAACPLGFMGKTFLVGGRLYQPQARAARNRLVIQQLVSIRDDVYCRRKN